MICQTLSEDSLMGDLRKLSKDITTNLPSKWPRHPVHNSDERTLVCCKGRRALLAYNLLQNCIFHLIDIVYVKQSLIVLIILWILVL